jgi:hypothetical protein
MTMTTEVMAASALVCRANERAALGHGLTHISRLTAGL